MSDQSNNATGSITSDYHRAVYRRTIAKAIERCGNAADLVALATEIRMGRALLVDPPARKPKAAGGVK